MESIEQNSYSYYDLHEKIALVSLLKTEMKKHSISKKFSGNIGCAHNDVQLEKKQINMNNNNNNNLSIQPIDESNTLLHFYIFNASRERNIHLSMNSNDKRLLIFYNISHGLYKNGVRNVFLVSLYHLNTRAPKTSDRQTLVLDEEKRLFIRLFKQDDTYRQTMRPFRILSGSLHYFRIFSDSWSERIENMKAAGLNTVETFIPWNVHEREVGKYDFDDLIKFLKLVHKHEMFTIIRPSAYIAAEWEFGGLPSWLLYDGEMVVRSSYGGFMEPLEKYYAALLPILAKYQYNRRNGGSIIAFQIEQEYGSYGADKAYLESLRSMYVKHGLDEIHFTADAPSVLAQGTLDDVWATVNFQREVTQRVEKLLAFRADKHIMVTEYWTGGFDQWGKKHRTGEKGIYSSDELESDVEEMLLTSQYEISVNFYMFCGGTNYGFTSGANHFQFKHFTPTVTSYDYDAPISESGDLNKKYYAIRNVIGKFYEQNPSLIIYNHERTALDTFELKDMKEKKKGSYGKIRITDFRTFDQVIADKSLGTKYESTEGPLCMEDLKKSGITHGYIVYVNDEIESKSQTNEKHTLSVPEIADSAIVLSNGERVFRSNHTTYKIETEIPADTKTLTIFVENLGRIYYGVGLDYSRKGILNNVMLDNTIELKKWSMILLDFSKGTSGVKEWNTFVSSEDSTTSRLSHGPKLFRATFTIEAGQSIEDTFLSLGSSWGKGVAFINGFNIGRYWNIGPQQTLFVPKQLLKKGLNYICLFELNQYGQEIELIDKPLVDEE
ncbi:unnamed protein product [Adineta steineri]|uniref:Beta-galactosidase n=1 Tax=Adineta steineri TaxID=433720 RepID=A0A815RB92_9BILA|nr:unnamed protein product [Adineta steineri]